MTLFIEQCFEVILSVAVVAKQVAVELACRLTGLTHRAVGAHYGVSGMAVSVVRKKLRDSGESAPANQAVARPLPNMVHVAK